MEYLSLYDYLGKPAGKELGGQVAQAAYQGGIKPQEREISNPKYTGSLIVTDWTPVAGAVGELLTASVTWPITGAITKATA